MRLELLYRCERVFEDLEGKDRVQRRCSQCRLDVIDLRAFTEEERERYLMLADAAEEEVCAVVPSRDVVATCREHPDSIRRTREEAQPPVYVGRVERAEHRSPSQERWEAKRSAVIAENSEVPRADRLAQLERRIAAARSEMMALVDDVRSRQE